jgi:O-antigen ligase
LIVGAILLLTVAIFFSYTRGTWLSLILSWVVLWVLYIKKIKHLLLITSLAILISITFFVQNDHYLMLKPDFEKAIVHAQLSEHIDAMYQMQDISISERIYRWVAGFRMSIVHPLFGFGPSTFYSSYKPFTDSRFKTYVSENPEKSTLHNYFLLTLVEQGFIINVNFYFIRSMIFFTKQY